MMCPDKKSQSVTDYHRVQMPFAKGKQVGQVNELLCIGIFRHAFIYNMVNQVTGETL